MLTYSQNVVGGGGDEFIGASWEVTEQGKVCRSRSVMGDVSVGILEGYPVMDIAIQHLVEVVTGWQYHCS